MKKNTKLSTLNTQFSFWHPASLICTCFGVGKIPFAPGTWGSLAGVVLAFFLLPYIGLLILPLFLIGWYCSNIYEKKTGQHDLGEIVVDEVVGQWITIQVGFLLAMKFELNPYLTELCGFCFLIKYAIFFFTFRFFDIIKPWLIGWVDKNVGGGLGVMLDDVLAGIAAGITSALIFWML